MCIKPHEVCDGIPHCPNATDEALHSCKFAKSANFECRKPDIGNDVTVWIKATKCNGIPECADREDEMDCVNTELITGVILAVSLIVFTTVSTIVVNKTKLSDAPTAAHLQDLNERELRIYIISQQGKDIGKRASNELYQRYIARFGNHRKAINKIKVYKFINFCNKTLEQKLKWFFQKIADPLTMEVFLADIKDIKKKSCFSSVKSYASKPLKKCVILIVLPTLISYILYLFLLGYLKSFLSKPNQLGVLPLNCSNMC